MSTILSKYLLCIRHLTTDFTYTISCILPKYTKSSHITDEETEAQSLNNFPESHR